MILAAVATLPGQQARASTNVPTAALTLKQLEHTAWSNKDGAPVEINALAQSSDGSLWIGTTTGLYRFNGIEFSSWEPTQDGPQMPSRNISTLYSEADGSLWIGYRFGGISLLKNGRFTNYRGDSGLPQGDVQEIVRDPQGSMWAAAGNELMQMDGSKWRNRSRSFYGPDNTRLPIQHFFFDQDDCLWVAAQDHVASRQMGSRPCSAVHNPIGYVTGFARAPSGAVWMSDYWRPAAPLQPVVPATAAKKLTAPSPQGANALLFADDGALWVATVKHGLIRRRFLDGKQPGPEESFDEADGLTSSQVVALLRDRQGNIWAGTSRGLDRFSTPKFVTLPEITLHGSPALAPRAEGGVWIADPFLKLYTYGAEGAHALPFLSGAYTLCTGANDTLWAATQKDIVQYRNGRVARFPIPSRLRDYIMQGMIETPDGALVVAFTYAGLWTLRDGRWIEGFAGFPGTTPLALITDPEGRIWAGYVNGIARMWDGSHLVSVPTPDDMGELLTFYEEHGRVWLGGSRGLAIFDGNRFRRVSLAAANRLRGISGIVRSRSGDLWLNGATGILRIPSAQVERALSDPAYRMDSELFDYRDGVSGHAPQLRPMPSAIADRDGRIWFSTSGSAVSVDPNHLSRNLAPPLVSVESLVVDGVRYDARNDVPLMLGVRPHKVQFSYIGVDLTSPDRVQYRYQLQGEDASWQDGGTERVASYTNLPPGEYRFLLSARNNDGVWNQAPVLMAFTVPPALTQTRTFFVGCILFALMLLWAIYELRMRFVTARLKDLMRERTSERLRIARDLHDTLLQGVQGLIMRLHFTARQMPDTDHTRKTLMEALNRADEVLEESREKVLLLRADEDNDVDLGQTLLTLSSQLRRNFDAGFMFFVDGQQRPLHPLVFEELTFIFREALTNALQHSGADKITAELIYAPEELRLQVSDNGSGVNPSLLRKRREGHWGLQGMRERAARIAGKFHISGSQDEGTTVEIRVPGNVAYLPDAAQARWKRAIRFFASRRSSPLPQESSRLH